jgi:hypothetical protein
MSCPSYRIHKLSKADSVAGAWKQGAAFDLAIYLISNTPFPKIKLTNSISGIGLVPRHPAQIPWSVFVVLVAAYTAIAPNFDQPFVNYAFASAVVFLFMADSGTEAWIAAVVAALGFSLCHAFFPRSANIAAPSVNLYAGMLGRGSLVVLGLRRIWASPQEGRDLRKIWLLPLGIVLFVLASLVALNLTVARSRVLDSYLYVFDGSLGFQPSFLLGRFFSRYKLFADLGRETYFALPLVIALVCAGYLRRGSPWKPLGIVASAGLLGYLLYFVFPATGPIYVAGATFLNSPHPFATLGQMRPHPIPLAIAVPRNAMPSLHMAWALLLWFNCRRFSRVWRGLALTYVLLMIVDTLGTGEHYLADLVVALPFAVAVQALWTPVQATTRYAVFAGAMSLTLIWLGLLRYGSDFFLLSVAVPWGCALASTVLSLALERFLRRFEPLAVDP